MPTNNFKLFDQNKANLLSDTEYANATQRLNGVQTGVASSQLNNKFAYQVSLVAYAIAQIMNQNGFDASDTLAVSAFVGNLGGSLMQKVADKASSTEAAAGVLTNKYISPATMKAAALLLSGGTMNGVLNMGNNKITNVATPTIDTDAATKGYVDELKIPGIIVGSYEGTAKYGVNHKNIITFPFVPTIVFIYPGVSTVNTHATFNGILLPTIGIWGSNDSDVPYINKPEISISNTTVSWYSTNDYKRQLNDLCTYYYFAIG